MATPIKFTLRADIRDWKLFSDGASAAGFNFSYLSDEGNPDYANNISEEYRYSISLPVPVYLSRGFHSFEPFILRNEEMEFLFTKSTKANYQVQVFSDSYNPKELSPLAEIVMKNIMQQYAYHRTISVLRPKDYSAVAESVLPDLTVKVDLRRWTLTARHMEEITVLAGPQKEEISLEISPEGLLTFDLSQMEEENKERYYHLLVADIGERIKSPGIFLQYKSTKAALATTDRGQR